VGRKLQQVLPHPVVGAERTNIKLTGELLEGFVRTFLINRFDAYKATPPFHKELWQLCCSPQPYVAIAAPRGHAKSSAGTLALTLASICFGCRDVVLIISATEKLAIDHLQEIKIQLEENEDIIAAFKVHGLSKDNETELIVHIGDRICRLSAKGAGQKLRGAKWRNKRPNLIIIDDLEEDEGIRSKDQRDKLARWFTSALIPLGSDNCIIRVFGTILHADSLLMGFINSKAWLSRIYKAHEAFDDFSNILWPEKYPETRLRLIRQHYIEKHHPSGYSQEMLNIPVADSDKYFRPEWFIALREEDRGKPMRFYSGIDFAISQSDKANKTAIATVGILSDGRMVFVDVRAGRWDSLEIIQQMFDVHEIFSPDLFIAEDGAIKKSIGPFLNAQMISTGIYINVVGRTPAKDKKSRASSLQGRFRSGGVLCDAESDWYPDFYEEMTSFTGNGNERDDRVDAAAWIGLELASLSQPADLEETEEEDYASEESKDGHLNGRCETTGY
jgi:predicted phage terminase large subunit-like protein